MRPIVVDGQDTFTGQVVGLYSSDDEVEAAKARLRVRPGFRDFPAGFRATSYRLDEEYDDPMFFTNWGPGADQPPDSGLI